MIAGIHSDVLLMAAYAIFLLLTSAALEAIARHTHRRSGQYETIGFRYDPQQDVWHCPAGQDLARAATDWQAKVVQYRAPAACCNCCPLKANCTDSNDGRVISHNTESWLQSEVRRFQRGISLVLIVLALFMLSIEMARQDSPREMSLLLALLLSAGAAGVRVGRTMMAR